MDYFEQYWIPGYTLRPFPPNPTEDPRENGPVEVMEISGDSNAISDFD